MAPSVVQQAGNAGTGTALTVTLGSPTTAGNCLVVFACTVGVSANGTVSGITLGGTAGNFAAVASEGTSTDHAIVTCWADPSCAGGQTSVAISTTGSSGTAALTVNAYEVSGMPSVFGSLLDQAAVFSSTGFVTSWTLGPTGTTSQASEIWFAVVAGNGSTGTAGTIAGPGAPWTDTALPGISNWDGSHGLNGVTSYQVVSSAGTASYNGTASPSSTLDGLVVTLKAAAVTPPAAAVAPSAAGGAVSGWVMLPVQGRTGSAG